MLYTNTILHVCRLVNRAPAYRRSSRRVLSALAALGLLTSLPACSPQADPPPLAPGSIKPTRDEIMNRIKSAPIPPDKKAEALRKFEQQNPLSGGKGQ